MRPTFRLGLSVLAALAIVACRTEHSSRPTPDAAVTATGPFALPGAEQLESTSLARLSEAWAQRPPGYVPRTRNVHPDGAPKFVNRMFIEASPYVRQHAHNPVDFRPWGDEAFAEAKRLGRPVLLSVGYSTCHWCHVMEEGSVKSTTRNRQFSLSRSRADRAKCDGRIETASDEGTLRPPGSGRGDVAVVTSDPALASRMQRALRLSGFSIQLAERVSKLRGALPSDVLVIDPSEDRVGAEILLDVLATVPTRPALVVVLRTVEDLRLATAFCVAVIAIDAVDGLLAEVVERARRDRRTPRLREE